MARILVIDDSASVLTSLDFYLRQAGHETHLASDGPTGLAAAAQQTFDFILLDLEMPRMSGIEVCKALKGDSKLAAVPVIIMTGCSLKGFHEQALTAGAKVILTKPFDFGALDASLKTDLPSGGCCLAA